MAWITLTPQHIDEALSAAELSALRTKQLAAGQTDPVPEAIARTTSEVNGYVAAWHGRQVGLDGTIPEELLSAAIAIARWRVITRLPAPQLATDARKDEMADARQQLRDAAVGKFAVSIPETPDEDQPVPQTDGAWGSATKIT